MRVAIVLGGGRSSRMGTNKLAMRVDGETLLARTCRAAARVAERVIVAGHVQPELDVEFVLEDPPFGGPVAGIVAGLAVIAAGGGASGVATGSRRPSLAGDRLNQRDAEALLLAGDLANPEGVVEALTAAEMGPDGVVLEDEEGWPQLLAGRYTVASLLAALDRAEFLRDVSVRRFLRELDLARVPAPPSTTADIDTPEQANHHGVSSDYDH